MGKLLRSYSIAMDTPEEDLIYAARNGNLDLIKKSLRKGADVNYQDHRGETALICAARKNESEICQFLLGAGADITIANSRGNNALTAAVSAKSAAAYRTICDFFNKKIEEYSDAEN